MSGFSRPSVAMPRQIAIQSRPLLACASASMWSAMTVPSTRKYFMLPLVLL